MGVEQSSGGKAVVIDYGTEKKVLGVIRNDDRLERIVKNSNAMLGIMQGKEFKFKIEDRAEGSPLLKTSELRSKMTDVINSGLCCRCSIILCTEYQKELESARAYTFLLQYPRSIHPQMLTHRWSRNSSSSRAIPTKSIINRSGASLLPPIVGKNKSGMVAGEKIEDLPEFESEVLKQKALTEIWVQSMQEKYNPHKEVLNRYLEPWMTISTIATMGEKQLQNFFKLRCHDDASPWIEYLASRMLMQYLEYEPDQVVRRNQFGWHIPFAENNYVWEVGEKFPYKDDFYKDLESSVARCAWVSYDKHGKEATREEINKRFVDCVLKKHSSPLEHQLAVGNIPSGMFYKIEGKIYEMIASKKNNVVPLCPSLRDIIDSQEKKLTILESKEELRKLSERYRIGKRFPDPI